MKKQILLGLLILMTMTTHAQERQVIDLNREWSFTPGYEVEQNRAVKVSLPNTWNLDAMSGKRDYYRGLGNYEKKLMVPQEWKGKRVYLRFGAALHTATLFINGVYKGEHQGGYTAFGFDISNDLRYGEENNILVRVSNAQTLSVMPLVGDFNFYGGIYRHVELLVLPSAHISPGELADSGVQIVPEEVTNDVANLTVRVRVRGAALLEVTLLDAQGEVVTNDRREVSGEGEDTLVEVPFTLSSPHLWHGTQDPYLYTARVTYGTDEVTQPFGVRYFQVDQNNRFFLNGKPYPIYGVGRHQEFSDVGYAVSREQMREDMALIREVGATAVRLTHYPHDPYFLQLCDEAGLIVWSEIPFVGPGGYRFKGFVDSPPFRENGKSQLAEMIAQLYNHPSILFWGLFNELKEEGDNPLVYVKELHLQAKEMDPHRLTVAASNQAGELNGVTDLIAFNQYFGWYGGEPDQIGKWGRQMRQEHPEWKVGVSEYGAGASPLHQQEELKKPIPWSRWHPENWQTHYHEVHWREMVQGEYFWGTFVWVMFDFYAAHRSEGERDGINDKGLVTVDRKTKKDAFYFYKANWNRREPFVYISERRLEKRNQPTQRVKVFSNQKRVELFLNGKSMGVRENDGFGTFLWKDLRFPKGQNTVEVRAVDVENVSDRIILERV